MKRNRMKMTSAGANSIYQTLRMTGSHPDHMERMTNMRERMTVNNLLIKEKVNRYDDGIQFPNCPEEKRRAVSVGFFNPS